ncbi:MAG TPA: bifunctional UDP-sugar hydrolase/5'-nucleotidase [Symbiobacteriaceae bacterium]|nr:bifunctional UDP-sugar hydrolase/5'-nucleotidase [Symbiobacteriaceae bacterium]
MNRLRRSIAALMAALLLTGLTVPALATADENNGVTPPPVWEESATYDWYAALSTETTRSPGKAETKHFDVEIKANKAKMTIENTGVTELDVTVNGQRLNLNTFFDNGKGNVDLDISAYTKYGHNDIEVQSLGKPNASAKITVEAPSFTARVLHTNDIHAAIDSLPKMAAYVKAVKAEGGNTYFIDAGDNFSGNPVSDLNQGQPMIEALNLMDVDVFTVGNHDFDHGPANMQALREQSNFEWLSANTEVVDQSATPIQPFEGYKIIETDLGQKIGFIALTQTPPATGTKNQVGLRFNDPVVVAQQLIAELRDQVNLLVVVSHNGVDWDTANAPALQGADLIIGAHSHTNLTKPTVVAGIPIVQVGNSGANVGDIVLTQTNTVALTAGAAGGAYEVATAKLTAVDPAVKEVVDRWNAQMAPTLATKIGYNTANMTSTGSKTTNDIALGNLIADSMRYYMDADMGVWNNGGIRADLPKGDITMNSVYKVLPFGNIPWKVELTGAQMVQLLANSFAKYNNIDLQISGASYVAYKKADGSLDHIDLKVAGEPVDLNRVYTLAVTDYVATTPAYWKNTTYPTPVEMSSEVDAAAMAAWVRHLGTVNYKSSEGRITTYTPSVPAAVSKLNFYNSSSLLADDGNGGLTQLTNQATVLVTTESTGYTVDRNDTVVRVDPGKPVPLVAMQNVGAGKVVGMGGIIVANGWKGTYQNPQYFTNVLDYLTVTGSGTVLFDEGHGQYSGSGSLSAIAAFIGARGYTALFSGEDTALTAAKLANVKVLVITTPGPDAAYTADELAVLADYVANGGNVVLMSQTDYYTSTTNVTELNNAAAATGTAIRFNSDEVRDDASKDGTSNFSPVTNEFNPNYPELLKVQ